MKNVASLLLAVCSFTSLHAQVIVGGEYFFDTDPGYGNATTFSVSPDSSITTNVNADLSGVEPGLHFCNVRVKDSNGRWSLTHTSLFFALQGGTSLITGGEYFFDTDPGTGNGV